jgi:endonuclease-3
MISNRNRIVAIDRLLVEKYGKKIFKGGTDPLTELVRTILSQNTNDTNRDRAFKSLKMSFPDWHRLADAPAAEIAASIKVAGLAEIRAARILKLLKAIYRERHEYSLDFLSSWPDNDIKNYLLRLEGIGPKTAACVMAFSLGRNVMPVDTHVYRVSRRLGIIPSEMNVNAAHEYFAKMSNVISLYQFHLNLIAHGRLVCHSQKPACGGCFLRDYCNFYRQHKSRKPHEKSRVAVKQQSRH